MLGSLHTADLLTLWAFSLFLLQVCGENFSLHGKSLLIGCPFPFTSFLGKESQIRAAARADGQLKLRSLLSSCVNKGLNSGIVHSSLFSKLTEE